MELKIFNTLAFFVLFSATFVITAKNPIHSVLFLVFVFFNVAGMLVLLGVEFLAMLLLIIYVGAVAVLFLFVIMMLHVKIPQTYKNLSMYIIGLTLVFLFEFYVMVENNSIVLYDFSGLVYLNNFIDWVDTVVLTTNTAVIGTILYTHYSFYFILCGYILLISMIGAIVLTLFRRTDMRRQEIYKQTRVTFRNTIKFSKR
jgi:NADH-quinone oxidoreductase subunit J